MADATVLTDREVFPAMDELEKRMLKEVAELDALPVGAFNIRSNGKSESRNSTANIQIESRESGDGINVYFKDGTKNESCHIPVIISKSGHKECVYNDFFIGEDCDVVIVAGCGTVGKAAIETLYNMGASVTAIDINIGLLRDIQQKYDGKINTLMSNRANFTKELPTTDLVIACTRWPKRNNNYMITREMVASMRRGSVIVDISNEEGCIETFHETTHENPIYIEEGVVHYCVANIPGAFAGSTSQSLAAGVLDHFRNIMNLGLTEAMARDGYLRRALTCYKGYLTHQETSGVQKRPWVPPEVILGIQDRKLDPAPQPTVTTSDNYYPEFNI